VREEAAALLRSAAAPPPWTPDTVEWRAQEVTLRGWAIPSSAPAFAVNGRPFDFAQPALDRTDIERLFWFVPGARESGFECRTELREDELSREAVRFDYVDGRTGKPFTDAQAVFYPGPSVEYPPLPDGPRRRRVHGAENEDAFVLEGYSSFVKLRRILESAVGKAYDDFTNILDWGCGCGRFARYFAPLEPPAYVGVDIDADNAAWCEANLPFGRFLHVPFQPPTSLEAESFDLLIGISVFTHLSELDQDEWLAELRRISAPSAILLMTIHGPSSVCRSGLSPEQVLEWRDIGFVDSGHNADLDDVLDESEDYRNAFRTHDYVRRRWARWFDVLDIVPGTIGNHQDVVVMRPLA